MPTYSVGELTIELRGREDERHHLPHVHVTYGNKAQVFDLNGNDLTGQIPKKQRNRAKEWIIANKDALEKEWRKFHVRN